MSPIHQACRPIFFFLQALNCLAQGCHHMHNKCQFCPQNTLAQQNQVIQCFGGFAIALCNNLTKRCFAGEINAIPQRRNWACIGNIPGSTGIRHNEIATLCHCFCAWTSFLATPFRLGFVHMPRSFLDAPSILCAKMVIL